MQLQDLIFKMELFLEKLSPSDWIQIIIAIIALFGPYIFEYIKSRYFRPMIKIIFSRDPNIDCVNDSRLLLMLSNEGNLSLKDPVVYLRDLKINEKSTAHTAKKIWISSGKHLRPYQLKFVNKDDNEYFSTNEIFVKDYEFIEIGKFINKEKRKRLIFSTHEYDYNFVLSMTMASGLPDDWFSLEPGEYRFFLKILGSNNYSIEYKVIMVWKGSYTEIINNSNNQEMLSFRFKRKTRFEK